MKNRPPHHATADLFGDAPAATAGLSLAIAAGSSKTTLSKAQKLFNNLIKQIDGRRERLAAWEAAIPAYQKRHLEHLLPLASKGLQLKIDMAFKLDGISEQKGLTKAERRQLAQLIADIAAQGLAERDDAALKAIYNKHSRSDFDKEEAANMAGLKAMMEDILGVELGDDIDLDAPDEMMAQLESKMHEELERQFAERQAREEHRAKRKKSAKQIAREEQAAAEEKHVSQSLREVYRKLASALHPDREPDPAERERKNVLMQKVNKAYDSRNLLQLLQLQLELEHIDPAALANLSEDRLRHYNQVLREQVAELDQEIAQVENEFKARFGLSPFVSLAPAKLGRDLDVEILRTTQIIESLEHDLAAFDDIKSVKAWLKAMRQIEREQARYKDFDDIPF